MPVLGYVERDKGSPRTREPQSDVVPRARIRRGIGQLSQLAGKGLRHVKEVCHHGLPTGAEGENATRVEHVE